MLEWKEWILYSFGGGDLLGLCGFGVNICDNLNVFVFNYNSLKSCSMVNFILECRFWSKLCKLLMLPHGHFQNMKQSFSP